MLSFMFRDPPSLKIAPAAAALAGGLLLRPAR
jgi:hypothetical protein